MDKQTIIWEQAQALLAKLDWNWQAIISYTNLYKGVDGNIDIDDLPDEAIKLLNQGL